MDTQHTPKSDSEQPLFREAERQQTGDESSESVDGGVVQERDVSEVIAAAVGLLLDVGVPLLSVRRGTSPPSR